MNELIFDQLRLDFEELVRSKGERAKQDCYRAEKGLEGAREFALCIRDAKQELREVERRGKSRLLFMELASRNPDSFNLL